MYKSYKTELNPTEQQKRIIENYFKVCIVAYNRYLSINFERLDCSKEMLLASQYLELIRNGTIKDIGSEFLIKKAYVHAVKAVLKNAEKALEAYLKGKQEKPRLKAMSTKNISLHFTASSVGVPEISCQRHRIKIPFIGWMRLKEKGYIPYDSPQKSIISGWIKKSAGRYYVSALAKEEEKNIFVKSYSEGLGVDLNINNFAVVSDGTVFENINKSEKVIKLEKKLARENRKLSRMRTAYKQASEEGIVIEKNNYLKQLHKVDIIYRRLSNIRTDYLRKCINTIVSKNPEFIAVEDLEITNMVADSKFSKYISDELFYQFRLGLYKKCKERDIEFRVVNKWFPSSKMCHECGHIRHDLSLDEREYICPACGCIQSRDLNASLNIRDTDEYKVWNM